MPARTIVAPPKAIDFDAIRGDLGIPDGYPAEAVDQARAAAAGGPAAGNGAAAPAREPLDVPFVTLDPPGSRDLDQAVHLSRRDSSGGYLVRYAIADVAGFVAPAGPLAQETWRRGATLYSPDRSTPLHPVELSEGAASLLPGVRRAAVRSVAQLDYPSAQRDADSANLHPSIALLPEIGRLRQVLARRRGAI